MARGAEETAAFSRGAVKASRATVDGGKLTAVAVDCQQPQGVLNASQQRLLARMIQGKMFHESHACSATTMRAHLYPKIIEAELIFKLRECLSRLPQPVFSSGLGMFRRRCLCREFMARSQLPDVRKTLTVSICPGLLRTGWEGVAIIYISHPLRQDNSPLGQNCSSSCSAWPANQLLLLWAALKLNNKTQ